jgi:Co/Zn/Cd efflux system component
MSQTELWKSAGAGMRSVLTHLQQSVLGLALVTAAGIVLWFAGWEVIGLLVTVAGGFGLFRSLVTAADAGGDVVTEAYGRSDSDAAWQLSKDEARLVTLIRDKKIDPSTIIARIHQAG